ncbi:MAG: hypothetical protein SFX74_07210 [Fimbriimonadaceae bacterium]|nr:hypothetical protein [Fimbriimonadaceae bacterium]
MAKGRFLKNAERACAGKARYDSQAEAEAGSDYRYAAYRCPVCGAWHLTSRGAPETRPFVKPDPPHRPLGPLLAEALQPNKPQPNKPQPNNTQPKNTQPKNTQPETTNKPEQPKPSVLLARVVRADVRPLLVLRGALVRAARPVPPIPLTPEDLVEIAPDSAPPLILRRVETPPEPGKHKP